MRMYNNVAYQPRRETSSTYTVFWSNAYCTYLRKAGMIGTPLRVLWGGHNQNTNYARIKIRQGDMIFPITVRNRKLFVIARMQVEQLLSVEAFAQLYPEHKHLVTHSCATEVLLGEDGTKIQLSKYIPETQVSEIRYCSRRGIRGIHSLHDGKIQFSLGLQGAYRLCPETTHLLNNCVE